MARATTIFSATWLPTMLALVTSIDSEMLLDSIRANVSNTYSSFTVCLMFPTWRTYCPPAYNYNLLIHGQGHQCLQPNLAANYASACNIDLQRNALGQCACQRLQYIFVIHGVFHVPYVTNLLPLWQTVRWVYHNKSLLHVWHIKYAVA